MKIAVISDIHGNKSAFDAVLNDINDKGCQMILCLGDIAMAGYDPNYVVEKFIELTSNNSPIKTEIITGNTDLMITHYSKELFEKVLKVAPCMAYSLAQDVEILNKKSLEFLKSLPVNKTISVDGVKIFMCHGSPKKIDEGITPDTAIEYVEELVKDINADIVLCGHTHVPCGFQLNSGKTVMNVGSVGRPMTFDKRATYAILDTHDNESEYTVAHQSVEYDNQKVAEIIKARNFKDCEVLANMFIEENK